MSVNRRAWHGEECRIEGNVPLFSLGSPEKIRATRLDGPFGLLSVFLAAYFFTRRRMKGRATRPAPMSIMVPGSGTGAEIAKS